VPDFSPVIIGAGPAGIRAAERLAAAGLSPVVIDENQRPGGQIYRQQPHGFIRSARARYGFEAQRADSVHAAFAAIVDRIDYRANSTVWNLEPQLLWIYDRQRSRQLPFSHLIIATGACDRIVPVPGWTLPGVFSLGGAQVSLKAQACSIGAKVIFAGTGALLYLVAYQYAKAGVAVAAVIDTGRFADRLQAAPAMLSRPQTLAKGLYYMAALRAHGVPMFSGAADIAISGTAQAKTVTWVQRGRRRSVQGDAVALGFGLRSETQLADLAECRFAFDPVERTWLPEIDPAGRSSVPGIYLAGDGTGIFGADAAELAGLRAAEALLADIGHPTSPARRAGSDQSFRRGLARAFPPPRDWTRTVPDSTIVCRCEEVTAGELRAAIADSDITEINRLKALTRAGMGRCQGRMCGPACQQLLADEAGLPEEKVGRLRAQAPIKPLPMGALTDEGDAQHD
jgi:hydrogen cyanide synthase HcnB